MRSETTRRRFLGALGALGAMTLASCGRLDGRRPFYREGRELVEDPAGLIDLPLGFGYEIVSQFGQTMADGYQVPDDADGMGCFPISPTKVALVRNHELEPDEFERGPFGKTRPGPDVAGYDHADSMMLPGSTTTLVYDLSSRQLVSQHLSLCGTIRNCAGGSTPWNTWLSCEEDVTRAGEGVGADHGYVFEVDALAPGLSDPIPIRAMGRFRHEAVVVHQRSGILYLTEDQDNGCLYRYLPSERQNLHAGGRLQALAIGDDTGIDLRNWFSAPIPAGESFSVRWIDVDGTDSANDDLRLRARRSGALRFARAEGMQLVGDDVYFCCTTGGHARLGQIFRYTLSPYEGTARETEVPGQLSIYLESTSRETGYAPDNLTVTPFGELLFCEDQYSLIVDNHLRLVTPQGEVIPLARLRRQTELAGACFAPDGTLFVNLFSPGTTLAIRGPWRG